MAVQCPTCRIALEENPGFVTWCEICGWNADPSPPKPSGRLDRRREARVARRLDELAAEVARDPSATVRPGALRSVMVVVALLVHLSTLGLLALAALAGFELPLLPFGAFLAILLVGITWVVFPRWPCVPKQAVPLADRPALAQLVTAVSAVVAAPVPDLLVVDNGFNASVGTRGVLRRRIVLTIGRPLWAVLRGEQKVALLGHELGHLVNGDLAHGFVVGSAEITLARWQHLFQGGPRRRRPLLQDRLGDALGAVLRVVRRTIDGSSSRASQRAEHRADQLAVLAGGSDGALGLLRALTVDRSIHLAGERLGRELRGRALSDALQAHVDAIPAIERRRLRVVARRRRSRIDPTHPPTFQRTDLLEAAPHRDPSVLLTPEDEAAVDDEVLGRR